MTVTCPLVYFPLNTLRCAGACCILFLSDGAAALELQLRADEVVAPNFRLQGVVARFTLAPEQNRHATHGSLDLRIAQATIQEREWRKLSLQCPQASIARELIACPQGVLESGEKIPLTFSYWPTKNSLELSLQPTAGERWQAQLNWLGGKLAAAVDVTNGKVMRWNTLLPKQAIQFGQGTFDLKGQLGWDTATRARFDIAATVRDGAFSDMAGTSAGEKLGGMVRIRGERDRDWQWNAMVDWRTGEVFWQPLYFAPGARSLSAQGRLTQQQVLIEQAQLIWAGIGTAGFSGAWDRVAGRVDQLQASGKALALNGLYTTFLQPLAAEGAMRKLALTGTADGMVSLKQGALERAALTIQNGALQQEEQRFQFNGINANLAWQKNQASENRLSVVGGKLGKLDIGAFNLSAVVAPDRVSLAPLVIPILDGALSVSGVEARRANEAWQWTLNAAVRPISMQRLSQALDLPTMHGTLSAVIPQVRYAGQVLQVDGAVLFKVFDGTVVVKDLAARDPFGPTPQIVGNIDMRNLDLDLLTQTFSFGSIQGRLDVTVRELEIFAWKPVRFDAKVASSAGDYPRKISQRAVENITAHGGSGGTAALQRSFLRLFDQFGYRRIGLSCRLARGICEMGGVTEAPTGYVIVEGGGIPALTVIGYNRSVAWDELLARLQRATQGGKPIVQ